MGLVFSVAYRRVGQGGEGRTAAIADAAFEPDMRASSRSAAVGRPGAGCDPAEAPLAALDRAS